MERTRNKSRVHRHQSQEEIHEALQLRYCIFAEEGGDISDKEMSTIGVKMILIDLLVFDYLWFAFGTYFTLNPSPTTTSHNVRRDV